MGKHSSIPFKMKRKIFAKCENNSWEKSLQMSATNASALVRAFLF